MQPPADLASLPKAELHIHLEGAVRPKTQEEILSREGKPAPPPFSSLNTFLDAFGAVWWSLVRPGDYARIMREYCEDAIRQGVRYAEIELGPIGRQYDVLSEVIEAADKSEVTCRFIASFPRQFPIAVAWATLEAVQGRPEVIGLGMGGQEDGYPPEPFAEVFAEGRKRGLHAIPHAGEDVGPESVRGALDALRAERIQHGVRSIEDTALLAELVERRLPLAVCPTSNVLLGVCETIDDHPLSTLWEAGALVSVNTDDPGFFDCDLVGEYAVAGRLLGLDREGYARLARNSIDGSFAPDALKAELLRAIDAWV
jgi:adenosine deaminase